MLFFLAFRALQPVGRLVTHDMSDLAPKIKDADAIAIVFRAFLVGRMGWRARVFRKNGNRQNDSKDETQK